MMRFATDVLGLKARQEAPDFAAFDLEDGDVFEIFGPRAIADEHQFMKAPVAHADPGGTWSHFFGPDGHVYEITSRA
ncbi:MAG TPA: hypothetical protein VFQ66_01570 [Candidatus Limnocylindria bacterium]|nr:hypothetical protein [Candidatus Limnocylindria bacterium]